MSHTECQDMSAGCAAPTVTVSGKDIAPAELGAEHGRDTASWLYDGNTTDETYRSFLMLEDGSLSVFDLLPRNVPSLNYADADAQDEYELAFAQAVETELVRAARVMLGEAS